MSNYKKKRAVVLISGSGSNLQAFIDQVQSGKLDLDIRKVISNNENAFGLQRAHSAGIETCVINHTQHATRREFDLQLIQSIDKEKADIVILAGFMRILTPEFVNHYQHRLLNIHPSLLPKYPGTHTYQKALDSGDKWHGCSVHFVTSEVDAGPIIVQGKIKINSNDDIQSLQQRVHKIEHIIYPQAVNWWINQRLSISSKTVLLDNEISVNQLQTFKW